MTRAWLVAAMFVAGCSCGEDPVCEPGTHGCPCDVGSTCEGSATCLMGICVDPEMDAGELVVSLEAPIAPEETAGELAPRLAELGGEASVQALAALEDGSARFEPQDEARVTLCSKLSKESGAIDWTRPAAELANLVRAMNPWPLARTEAGEKELLVLAARPLPLGAGDRNADAAPGTIRAEFAESVGENSVHGSDAPETAAVEIAYFFSGIELVG